MSAKPNPPKAPKKSAKTAPPRFDIIDGDEALKPQPQIQWLIENLIIKKSISTVFGKAGAKKTYSMLDLGVCAATGEDWLDFKTKQCPVLIVDEESGKDRMLRRLHETMHGHQVKAGQTKIKFVSLSALRLLEPLEQNELLVLVLKTGAKLVIIDALVDVLIGGDENSSTDMQTLFQGLRRIADVTGAAFIVIHHTNRADKYRGSSAMPGAIDLMLKVESKDDSPNIDFESEKTRDIEPTQFAAVAHFDNGTFKLTSSSPKPKQEHFSTSESFVMRFLEKADASMDEIEANADTCTPNAARQAVNKLMKRGKVERRNPGAKGVPARYGLAIDLWLAKNQKKHAQAAAP